MNSKELQRLINNLPEHPNILGKERFLNAAVLIPFLEINHEFCFLFQKRSAHIRQGGEVCFPGGEFEPGKDPNCREAAIREAVEELGIDRELINIQGRLDTFISPRGITVDSFLAILDIDSLENLCPDENEVERLFLIPVSWFEHNPPQRYHLDLEIHPYFIDDQGKKKEVLPVQDLGLPPHYSQIWSGQKHRVLIYQTPEEVVWGITAELVYEIIQLLSF